MVIKPISERPIEDSKQSSELSAKELEFEINSKQNAIKRIIANWDEESEARCHPKHQLHSR